MFPKFSRRIAAMYKWLGLISIPLLTIATTISIANVFTHGQIAGDTRLQFAWAFLFAAAIEVNIVRLFFEWKVDQDNGAKWLGIILAIVAGVALVIEGLQQSIGFDWSNVYVQGVIGFVVVLRVVVVVLLLAREGSRLGSMQVEPEQVSIQPMLTESIQEPITESIQIEAPSENVVAFTSKHLTPAAKRVQKVLKVNPDASLSVIAAKANVSRGYASQIRAKVQNKQVDMVAQ